MAKSPAEMLDSMIRNLEEKTGLRPIYDALVAAAAEVDDELLGWLREAYDRA